MRVTSRRRKDALSFAEKTTGVKPVSAFVDLGYRGHDVEDTKVWVSRQKRGVSAKLRREIKRRQAIEQNFGHMKNGEKLDCCRLWGEIGDQLHALLVGASYNFKLILNFLRIFFVQILMVLRGMVSSRLLLK